MCILRGLIIVLAVSLPPAFSQTLLTRADLDAKFAKAPQRMTVPDSNCCEIRFEVLNRKTGPEQAEQKIDRVIWVRSGHATATLNRERKLQVGPEDLINVPRGTAVRLDPGAERLETIEVRVFPVEDAKPPRFGALKPMGDVLTKADQDRLFEKFDTEQSVYVQPHFRVALVIRKIPSDWESHGCCADIYLPFHAGTAHMLLGGTIENAKERSPGEMRGTGITGGKATVANVGDMVIIPRGGVHYVDPRPGKIAYLIVKVQAE
jgi:mannose-6-phosphate isomerase-like protein (cupin superfamily)